MSRATIVLYYPFVVFLTWVPQLTQGWIVAANSYRHDRNCDSIESTKTPLIHYSAGVTMNQNDVGRLSLSSSLSLSASNDDWAQALRDSTGPEPGAFERDMINRGFLKKGSDMMGNKYTDPKLQANVALIEWLRQEGGMYLSEQSSWGEAPHPMAISTETRDEITNESSGRGLLARRDINDGDLLMNIPLRMCITKSTALDALGEDALPIEINEYLAIACLLISERFVKHETSFWTPYLNILPETNGVNPTFTWSDDDLSFLQGSPIIAATISLRNKLRREYDTLLTGPNGLMVRFPDRFPEWAFTYDNWVWAFTMLFSRAIRLPSLRSGEILAMVPYADLINHSPFSRAYLDARAVGDWIFQTGDDEVILFADRRYGRMDQIYISYGPKSNDELLLLYGFAVERNPYNSVDVTVSIKSLDINDDPLAIEKAEFLQRVGRDATVDFPCYADRYPTEMLEYLRLMQMTEEDTAGKPLSEFDYSRTISPANEAAVLNSVIKAVQQQLQKYPQTEDEDAALIKDKSLFRLLNTNQRMAVRHRRNEKRLLKRTIAALEKQIIQQGLDRPDLARADGSTLGKVLPGDERKYGMKQKTSLEDRLEKMGLPVDLR